MKKSIYLFAILAAFAFAPQPNATEIGATTDIQDRLTCKDFHNGSFKTYDSLVGHYYIERHGSVQIEYAEKLKLRYEVRVKWINDCTFELKTHKILENPNNIDIGGPYTVKNKIIEIRENSFVVQTTMDGYDLVLTKEYFVDKSS